MQKKLSKRLLSIFTVVLMIAGIIAGTISVKACEYCDASKNKDYLSNSRSLYADPCDLPEGRMQQLNLFLTTLMTFSAKEHY